MKNTQFGKLAVVAGVLAIAGAASAQTNGPAGISARLGVFFPTQDAAQSIGKTWFAGGLDYKLSSIPLSPTRGEYTSYLSVSGDYYEKSGLRAIPVALNYNVRVNQVVFSGGIGADFVRVADDDSSGFAGQLGVSYEFANSGKTAYNPFFVQAKYFFSSKSDLNGVGLYVGYRF